jgi:hypothetical protein
MTRSNRRRSTRTRSFVVPEVFEGTGANWWRAAADAIERSSKTATFTLFKIHARGSGVAARDLEEVLDEGLEGADVGGEQIEGGARFGRQRVGTLAHHGHRRGQRRERRAQLVTDVGGETCVAGNAFSQFVDHVVKGVREGGDLGALRVDVKSGVEAALGDASGRRRGHLERTE